MGSGWQCWARVWKGGVVLCLCELRIWIICVDGRPMHLYIVLGGYLHIFGALRVQSCCTLSISASYRVFVGGRYHKSRLVCMWLSDIASLYEEQWQSSSGSVWLACPHFPLQPCLYISSVYSAFFVLTINK